jgi:predicted MPP superfamily phosphohydrolase
MLGQIVFLMIVVFIWVLLHGYVGLHGWKLLSALVPIGYIKIYWFIIIILAGSFLITRIFSLPVWIGTGLTWISSYWLAILYYSFLFFVIMDTTRLINRWLKIIPAGPKLAPFTCLAVYAAFIIIILVYGTINAMNPVFRQYEISIPKMVSHPSEIHTIVVSDLHLGLIVNEKRLNRIVDMIKEKAPDLVLMPGDIIDDHLGIFEKQNMALAFQKLKPSLGMYAVLGNHEYIAGDVDRAIANLTKSGIMVLRDTAVELPNGLILAGRDDLHGGFGRRTALEEILQGVNHQQPIIMMDHQPVELDKAQANGVDLQVSGHTHLGQLFPNQLVTRKIYEIDHGYLQKEGLQVIVTCGAGTWGPPIRIGNRPEIVEIIITFTGYK